MDSNCLWVPIDYLQYSINSARAFDHHDKAGITALELLIIRERLMNIESYLEKETNSFLINFKLSSDL